MLPLKHVQGDQLTDLEPVEDCLALVEQVVGRIEGDPKPECQPRKQTCVRVCLMSADDCQCDPSASST